MANYLNKARVAILTISVQAAAALAQCRAVGADGNYASAGAHMTGVTFNPATAGAQTRPGEASSTSLQTPTRALAS